jgi:hypothetical protein
VRDLLDGRLEFTAQMFSFGSKRRFQLPRRIQLAPVYQRRVPDLGAKGNEALFQAELQSAPRGGRGAFLELARRI